MAIEIVHETVRGWQGIVLRAGAVELGLAPELGGRIVSLQHEGEELLFVHPARAGETLELDGLDEPTALRAAKRQIGHRLWGGDKTWIAPQVAWWEAVPPLDVDAGRYDAVVEADGVTLVGPVCRETGLRVTRRVTLDGDGRVTLEETLLNTTAREVRRGLWNVTQCERPLDVHVPVRADTVRAVDGEGEGERLRSLMLLEADGWTRIACREAFHFKYGALPMQGAVVALRSYPEETLAWVRSFPSEPLGRYAHDAAVEVYNDGRHEYLEIEVHAPMMPLGPGGTVTLRQRWRLARLRGAVSAAAAWRALGADGTSAPGL